MIEGGNALQQPFYKQGRRSSGEQKWNITGITTVTLKRMRPRLGGENAMEISLFTKEPRGILVERGLVLFCLNLGLQLK